MDKAMPAKTRASLHRLHHMVESGSASTWRSKRRRRCFGTSVARLGCPLGRALSTPAESLSISAAENCSLFQFRIDYPPVLITTGLNDPRAAPWEAAQLAAALQASGTARPILLRVDEDAGHGIASTKSQDDALYADMWAFVFWRAGLPDWRPRFSVTDDAYTETGIEDDALLALPWKQFDQTLGSGWRVYAMREEHLLAARLIETYLARRSDLTPVQRAVLHFHAGAELARVNLHKEALLHFDQAIVPADSKGVPEDWNELVTANRAFLLGDRAALLACKQRVDAMRSPAFRETFALLLEYLGQPWGAWDDQPKH